METVLKTRGLTKSYGHKKVVNNVNLTLNRGEIYGLIGRNGAGKTTLAILTSLGCTCAYLAIFTILGWVLSRKREV